MTPSSKLYWLRMADLAKEIVSYEDLLRALASHCWQHRSPKPPKDSTALPASVAYPKYATIGKAPAPANTEAIRTALPPPSPSRPEI